MINNYTIFGERCSGTNYLESLININFEIDKIEICDKHFFGHIEKEKLKEYSNTLFICIVRNPFDTFSSLFKILWHLPLKYKNNLTSVEKADEFLNKEIYSVNDKDFDYKSWDSEIMEDRHIYTKERYKNIFELRHTKLKYMIDDLPNIVDNYILIKYEDLLNNFEETMNNLKNKGLKIKTNIKFPVNYYRYKNTLNDSILYADMKQNKNNDIYLPELLILNNKNLNEEYEKKLGYL